MDSALNWNTLQNRTLPIGKLSDECRSIEARLRQGPYSTVWERPSLGQVSFPDHSQLRISVMTICAKEALKWMALGATGGATIGSLMGACSYGQQGLVPGAALGVGAGGTMGFIYGFHRAKIRGQVVIENSHEYKEWKQNLTQTEYRLFLNTIKRYIDEESVNELVGPNSILIDPISLDLITFPVLSPHGHVYDKEYIERALDKDTYATDPMGCPLYEKEDLVYAGEFARRAIGLFKLVLERLDKNPIDDNQIFRTGLSLLLEQYRRDNEAVTYEVISDLTADLIREGASKEQRRYCLGLYRRSYEN